MKKFIAFPALLLSMALLSCNGNDAPEVDTTIGSADTTKAVTSTVVGDSSQVAAFANTVNPTPTVTGTSTPAITAATKGGGAGANPAHGQPGHRCDIAVGAPLNSPVTSPTQPGIKTSVTPATSVTASPSATITAPSASPISADPNAKLNPAHGQPGHDCSIAVGAPLKKN